MFKPKDKDVAFRQRFMIPLIDKSADRFDGSRPAPTLGMRQGATFVVKPLHDPSGEFAIVLYDPTVDDVDEPGPKKDEKEAEAEKPTLDEPLVHKSLADILGIKKKVEDRPKVPVVIDPRLAKVLRPHQVEGVKVRGFSTFMVDWSNRVVLVPLSMYNGHGRQECKWLHHGRRDGVRENGECSYIDVIRYKTDNDSFNAFH